MENENSVHAKLHGLFDPAFLRRFSLPRSLLYIDTTSVRRYYSGEALFRQALSGIGLAANVEINPYNIPIHMQ